MNTAARKHLPARALDSVRILDPVLTILVFLFCVWLHGVNFSQQYRLLATAGVLVTIVVFNGTGLYRHWTREPRHHHYQRIFLAWGGVIGILMILGYASKITQAYSRIVVLSWALAVPVLITCFHVLVLTILKECRRRGWNMRSAVVIGGGELASRVLAILRGDASLGVSVHGYFDDQPSTNPVWLGSTGAAADYVRKNQVNCIYIALPLSAEGQIRSLLQSLHDAPARVYLVPDLFTFGLLEARLENLKGIPLVALGENPMDGGEGLIKRCMDLMMSMVLLLLVTPVLVGAAVAIKFSSRGPVLFKQRRYGIDGTLFDVYKFRTMTVCEDGAFVPQAKRNDPRVTRVGKFLRATSLDELPQLLNVLQGSMSLVGPRPHAVAHNEFYRQKIPEYMLRHRVKPGITGWAQVHGLRGETETIDKMRRRVEYDLYYIRHWSLLMDFHILCQTCVELLHPHDVY